jgi:nitrate/nitrite transporter NarK
MIEQSQWRKWGMVCLGVSSAMAVFSIPSEILRHTIYKVLAPFNDKVEVPSDAASWWLIVPYWLVFSAVIVVALYLAFLDIRYIRLQFAVEKRKLFEETMRDPLVPRPKGSGDAVEEKTK